MKKRLFTVIAFIILVFVARHIVHASALVHKAQSGDNLNTISKKYRVSVATLKKLNNLSTTKLSIGQTVLVKRDTSPAKGAKKGKAPRISVEEEVSSPENDEEFIRYKTRSGDTIDRIAQRFNLETQDIVEANDLSGQRLKPGRTILIPKMVEVDTEEFISLPSKPLKSWKSGDEKYMLVKVAKSFVGAPYKLGGESVRGLDCSAFVKKIYGIFEVELPRSAREQFKVGSKISKEELAIGDLVFFKTKRYAKYPTHVGIFIGEGNFIHASSGHNKIGVKIDSLSSDFYSRAYFGATRVKKSPEENPEVSTNPEKTENKS